MAVRAIYADEPLKGWRPWGALVPVLGLVLIALPTAGLNYVLVHLNLLKEDVGPIGFAGFVAFLLIPFGALGLVILAWVRFVERRSLATIGLTGAAPLRTFLGGHLTGIAMMTTIVVGDWIAGGFAAGQYAKAFHSAAGLTGIAVLAACFALQSSVEEITLRGWMFSAIAAKLGVIAGIVLSSLVFTLLHYDLHQPLLFTANIFLFAVFACCWVLRTGNVWGIMGWHAGWNWLVAVGFELRVTSIDAHMPALLVKLTPAGPAYLTGGKDGPEASLFCTLVLLGGIAFELARRRRNTNATS